MKDEFRHRSQNAEDQQGCALFLLGFEHIREHHGDGDCAENGNCEAVICQQRSQNDAFAPQGVEAATADSAATDQASSWRGHVGPDSPRLPGEGKQ